MHRIENYQAPNVSSANSETLGEGDVYLVTSNIVNRKRHHI